MRLPPLLYFSVLSAFVLNPGSTHAETNLDVLNQALPKVGEAGSATILETYAGGIVLLDFFAWWCPPCEGASRDIGHDLEAFYKEKGGNPHGVTFTVVGINVDQKKPGKTESFIRKTGMAHALNDIDGALEAAFKVKVLPTLVLVDLVDPDRPRVLLQREGYFGPEEWRNAINQVTPKS